MPEISTVQPTAEEGGEEGSSGEQGNDHPKKEMPPTEKHMPTRKSMRKEQVRKHSASLVVDSSSPGCWLSSCSIPSGWSPFPRWRLSFPSVLYGWCSPPRLAALLLTPSLTGLPLYLSSSFSFGGPSLRVNVNLDSWI